MTGRVSSAKGCAEAWFFDVGQGSCNLLYLGGGRAIVIDCGKSPRIPLSFIERYVSSIEWLIVTHNDDDHDKGAVRIIDAHAKKICNVAFLQDRSVEKMRIYDAVRRAREDGNLSNDPVVLLAEDRSCRRLFEDRELGISLELLFPTFMDTLDAQNSEDANAASAVLALVCGKRRILYTGDVTISGWRKIHKRLGARSIPCEIVAVPHHGGKIWKRSVRRPSSEIELRWLYAEAVRAKVGVISVGTGNPYRHPKPEVIRALCEANVGVMCTQITKQCHWDLEGLRPGVIWPDRYSQSTIREERTGSGRSRNVGCAGTVLATVFPDRVEVQRFAEHQEAVDRVVGRVVETPLCRKT